MTYSPGYLFVLLFMFIGFRVNADDSLPKHGLKEVVFDLQMVAEDGSELPLDPEFLDHAIFNFPFISGGIFGSPDDQQERKLLFADENNQITLDLHAERKRMDKAARKLDERFKSMGLVIDSKRTQLLRIGTFAYHLEDLQFVSGTWASDKESGGMLVLTYFDRKTSLTGDLVIGDEVHKHDIVIPKKGYYWIKTTEIKPGIYLLERAQNYRQVNLTIRVRQFESVLDKIT